MTSADFFKPLSLKTSHGKSIIFPSILPDLHHSVPNEFWASLFIAKLPHYNALYLISVRQYLTFATGFLQILPHDRHPCHSLTIPLI